jgi:hypothetical protein
VVPHIIPYNTWSTLSPSVPYATSQIQPIFYQSTPSSSSPSNDYGQQHQSFSSPLISIITTAQFAANSSGSGWIAPSIVVLIEDNGCTILVNTGLAVQRNELIAGNSLVI